MKRLWIAALAVCMAAVLSACGKSADRTQEIPAAAESQSVETKDYRETEISPEANREAPGDTKEFKILTGEVVRVSEDLNSMTLLNGETEITLNLGSADVETSYALDAGVEVSVIYKGELSGSDASNASLVLVLDAQEGMEVKEAVGTVADQAMSSFTIHTEAGADMGFIKDNCEGLSSGVLGQASDDSNGSGAMVRITYVTVNYDAGSQTNFPLKVEAVQ